MAPIKNKVKDDLDEPRLNQPKAPSSAKDWEAMDIFVFSNGQQYSPPRKYHLKAEELNLWQATLGSIACSQYGAMYSTIELYSIDGHKISSPVELRDGSAYVAVVPPDTFIDAGYKNYIIKASKSWEKRQSKLKSFRKERTNENLSKSKMSIEDTEEKHQNSTRDVSQSGSSQRKTVQGSSQQGSNNNGPTVILKSRRRPYSGSNRTSILRKLNNELKLLPEAKKLAKRKEEPVKDNVKVIIPLAGNLNNKSVKNGPTVNKISTKLRAPINRPDTPTLLHHFSSSVSEGDTHERPPTKKITEITEPVQKKEPKVSDGKECELEDKEIIILAKGSAPADKKESTDNFEIQNVLRDKEIIVISNTPKKEEDDLMYMFWNLNDDVIQDKLDPEPLVPKELNCTVQAVKETQTTDVLIKTITRASSPIQKPSRNNSKTEAIKTDHATQSELITSDEPLIAVANNGDAINLKLNIELDDNSGVVNNVQVNIVVRPQSSEDDQGNQNTIDIDEIIKESKSMKSLPDCDCECAKNNNNIYVLQCSCDHEHTTNNNDRMYANVLRHDHAQKTYLIVVPIVTVLEKSTKIRSEEKSKQNAEKEVQNDDEIVTVVNFMDGGQEMYYFPRHLPLSIEYKEISISGVTSADCIAMPQDCEVAGTSSKSTEISTQTEWCSIVLEVRRHEDGRYTFHLPSLQILRSYNKDL